MRNEAPADGEKKKALIPKEKRKKNGERDDDDDDDNAIAWLSFSSFASSVFVCIV